MYIARYEARPIPQTRSSESCEQGPRDREGTKTTSRSKLESIMRREVAMLHWSEKRVDPSTSSGFARSVKGSHATTLASCNAIPALPLGMLSISFASLRTSLIWLRLVRPATRFHKKASRFRRSLCVVRLLVRLLASLGHRDRFSFSQRATKSFSCLFVEDRYESLACDTPALCTHA